MKTVIQIILLLCLAIGGLAMMYKCRNVGSGVLSSCQSNSNIKIAKTNDKKGYKLSLHLQSTWWAPNDEWIECRKLCEVCRSLPETDDDDCENDHRCEQEVDMFLNSFCASATPTTHTSTVTDTQTITNIQTITSTSTSTETATVTSITTTTDISITTITKQFTITNVRSTTIFSTLATTTTEMITITPILPTTTIVSTAIVTVSPTCTPHQINTDAQLCQTTITTVYLPSVQNNPVKTQALPSLTIALGSLTGLFFIVLVAVIIGWVWTCWTIIKKRGGMDISSKNMTAITNTNGDEQYFENPTYYEDASATLNLTSGSVRKEESNYLNSSDTNYNTIHENGEDGPAYDVLKRGKATDQRQGRVVTNLPRGEDYSKLGLCDNDVENNYQLLDKEDLGSKVKK